MIRKRKHYGLEQVLEMKKSCYTWKGIEMAKRKGKIPWAMDLNKS